MALKYQADVQHQKAYAKPNVTRRPGQMTFAPVFDAALDATRNGTAGALDGLHRPIDNHARRTENLRVLVESLQTKRDLWMSAAPPNDDLAAKSESQSLIRFLESLRLETKLRLGAKEDVISAVVDFCLESITSELLSLKPNLRLFRNRWFLLWPVLSDYGLLPDDSTQFRVMIQRLITSSF